MAWALLWWPAADATMDRTDAVDDRRKEAIVGTLARLEADPFEPRLGTRQFRTPEYGHIRATSCRFNDWYILWQVGEAPRTLEIVTVAQIIL